MTSLPNLAICGKMRSGKNAVSDYLAANYGYTPFAFGDELKRHYHAIFGETDTKPREGYQSFGQFCRQYDLDIWVRKCFENVERNQDAYDTLVAFGLDAECALTPFRAVITDTRQPNEFDRCRSEGYVIIRVTAPEALRIDRAIKSADMFNLRDLTHDTESHVDSFAVDYEIVNDGTLAELYAKIDEVMRNVGT